MKKLKNEGTKRNNGITLIALVITIIVLLILAGVTIATLTGENGILSKASEASEETRKANAEEQVNLAVVASIGEEGKIILKDLNNELRNIEGILYNDKPMSNMNRIKKLPATVNVDGYDIIIDIELEETVPIPSGFYHVGDTTVEEGYVISNVEGDDLNNTKAGNQYVWIPVDGILGEDGTIEDVKGTNGEKEILLGRYNFGASGIPSVYSGDYKEETPEEHTVSGCLNTVAKDIEGFIDSVRENGGYYIARFEASKGSNNKPESKYDKPVWVNITQPSAASACQNLYSGVNSDLMNSYAWDTAILFIQKYSGDEAFSVKSYTSGRVNNTGKNDLRCNIYDMGGNCYEFTTETATSSYPCMVRGGHISAFYTSNRNIAATTTTDYLLSFRPILYL